VKVTAAALAGDNTPGGRRRRRRAGRPVARDQRLGGLRDVRAGGHTRLRGLAAIATSSELTVRDPSAQSTGHLVNGGRAMAHPVQVRATNAANRPPGRRRSQGQSRHRSKADIIRMTPAMSRLSHIPRSDPAPRGDDAFDAERERDNAAIVAELPAAGLRTDDLSVLLQDVDYREQVPILARWLQRTATRICRSPTAVRKSLSSIALDRAVDAQTR
jgi:hypothetical protein